MEYKPPILVTFFKIYGVIVGIIGLFGAFSMSVDGIALSIVISAALGSFSLAVFLYGAGQVIDYFGRTAHYAEESHHLIKRRFYAVEKSLQQIDSRIGDRIEFMHSNLREGAQNLKEIKDEIETLSAGSLAQLNWLPHMAEQKKES
jgi:hypothetical protein